MAEETLLHPPVVWAQRKDVVFLTIRLEDTRNPEIKLEQNKMTFRGKGGLDQEEYGFEFIFFSDIIPEESKQHITKRELTFVLKKKEEADHYWPRLLSSNDKVAFVKTDFDKWRDSDDSDDDTNVNQNFEDMMRQMGDIPGTGGGEAGADEADSDDSDDEDMPGLE